MAKRDATGKRDGRVSASVQPRRPPARNFGRPGSASRSRAASSCIHGALLDEPFAALDRKLREDMRLEIRALQRKIGITTVFVTHDQEEA